MHFINYYNVSWKKIICNSLSKLFVNNSIKILIYILYIIVITSKLILNWLLISIDDINKYFNKLDDSTYSIITINSALIEIFKDSLNY